MKKIISILLMSFLLLGMCSLSYAASGTITIDTRFDSAQNGVVAYGSITSDRANVVLTMTLTSPAPESKIIYSDYLRVPYDDGSTTLSYEFPAISMHPKYSSGTYLITVSSSVLGASETAQYDFVGADIQLNAVKAVNDALIADSKTALADAILAGHETLGIDKSVFEDLGNDGLLSFNTYMLSKQYELPENVNTTENIEMIGDAILAFRNDYLAALAIGAFNDLSTSAGLISWINDNAVSITADSDNLVNEKVLYDNTVLYLAYDEASDEDKPEAIADDSQTTLNEAELCRYIKDATEDSEVLMSYIDSFGVLYNVDEIAEAIYESALLTILSERHYTESQAVFAKFPEVFSADTASLKKLDSVEQGTAYSKACKHYDTVELAGAGLNSVVADIIADRKDNTSSGSSGNGGGGGGYTPTYVSPGVSTVVKNPSDTPSVQAFPDVPSDMWAHKAVGALGAKGIISGDGNGNFNPYTNITRAEYIKLMVMATKADLNADDAGFMDVADADWFKPYLDAAYAAGLIVGDAGKNANPNAYITREDMAVIMYRAYNMYSDGEYPLTFADAESISDYAKTAVAFLANKAIVTGTGDGNFAPRNNATRAEAAQIIYNMLNSVESMKTR